MTRTISGGFAYLSRSNQYVMAGRIAAFKSKPQSRATALGTSNPAGSQRLWPMSQRRLEEPDGLGECLATSILALAVIQMEVRVDEIGAGRYLFSTLSWKLCWTKTPFLPRSTVVTETADASKGTPCG